jgi:hypothetical protein
VRRCAFDEDVELLRRSRGLELITTAGLEVVESRFVLFFPWRSNALAAIERRLGRVPLGAQFYLAGRKRAR